MRIFHTFQSLINWYHIYQYDFHIFSSPPRLPHDNVEVMYKVDGDVANHIYNLYIGL